MKARDIMTRDVIAVRPDTSVRDIATLMVEKHISGVPVLTDNGKLIGMVSQSDLLHRAEVGTERKHKWWFRIFADSRALAREYAKTHGLKAHDIMSRYVVSVRDDAELRDVADILDKRRIKRVPVIQEDRVVGADNCVSWHRRSLQIPPQRHRQHYVRARVRVHQYPDGSLAIFDGPRCLVRFVAEGRSDALTPNAA